MKLYSDRPLTVVFISGFVLLGLFLCALLIPDAAQAQNGLTVCGLYNPWDCQLCHLFKLADNIIRYLIILAPVLAALLFSYAGFIYATSGGSTHNVEKAKEIFKDVLIGLIIILCSFLVVDTLLRSIARGKLAGPGWSSMQCIDWSVREKTILAGGLGKAPGLVNPDGTDPTPAVDPKVGSGQCAPGNFDSFGAAAQGMSCICSKESQGNDGPSTTDLSWIDGKPFSTGYMQINMVNTAPFTCDAGGGTKTYDCRQAFTADQSQMNRCTTLSGTNIPICGSAGWAYKVTNDQLYAECVEALRTTQCNFAAAKTLYDARGFQPWSNTAKSCNLL